MSDTANFERDIASHVMEVIRDDGVNRHVRFRRPGTMCMHFDLITWPGYLCYTGDMGTYVFSRLDDMFQFFRRSGEDKRYRIDLRYWAEKVQAQDKCDGIKKFSADKFKDRASDGLTQYLESHGDELDADQIEELRDQVECAVDTARDSGAGMAYEELRGITATHRRRQVAVFEDFWEVDCTEFTHRFVWCCNALAWAIAAYDRASADVPLRMGACT